MPRFDLMLNPRIIKMPSDSRYFQGMSVMYSTICRRWMHLNPFLSIFEKGLRQSTMKECGTYDLVKPPLNLGHDSHPTKRLWT